MHHCTCEFPILDPPLTGELYESVLTDNLEAVRCHTNIIEHALIWKGLRPRHPVLLVLPARNLKNPWRVATKRTQIRLKAEKPHCYW